MKWRFAGYGTRSGLQAHLGAQHQRRRELNRLKNRVTAPNDSDINSTVTLAAMLAPGDDRTR